MRCTFAKETLVIGKFVPPLWKGFASVRSTLAGVAETGSETAQRLEGFAQRSLSHLRFSIISRRRRTFSLRSSLLSFISKKIPAGAGIFIAFILPNKRQIRRQSERQRRLQSPMRRYRRARGECLSGRRPRRTCPWAYVREFSRFSESASRRRS